MSNRLKYLVLFIIVMGISAFIFLRLIPSAEREKNTVIDLRPIDELIENLDACTGIDIKRRQIKCAKHAKSLIEAIKRSSPGNFDYAKRSSFDVYLKGQSIIYLRQDCSAADVKIDLFSLNYYPNNLKTIPESRRKYGFVSLDFLFSEVGYIISKTCLVLKKMPNGGGISNIITGQFFKGKGFAWRVQIK